ncbi:hypothetical protein CDD82_88 [Ophiocordyceps australis]|uniref:L-ascorbate oxidase n=1 Tax=Ophiocordyceps australis TaxID=1399860 RepID=A0A2C5XT49_9HYPO|nr:hypothetical protein CDD82_88 [Ophiocordyceps australis]
MRWVVGALALLMQGVWADLEVHGKDFQPEYVLEATLGPLDMDCQTRESVMLNNSSPGPTLYLKEGQTTWVRVYNNIADQNITLHWHGLGQRTAPFSDGTPLVSQWPIPPGSFFDYEIRPEFGDAGTYFYHSHVGFQLSTAHGALIVEDAQAPPYEYDKDIIAMVGDFYPKTDEEIIAGLSADPFRWSGEPKAVTIQGHSGRVSFGETGGNETSCTPHVIEVEPSKQYRLRVIGSTIISLVKMGIEEHSELQVIEADGHYTEGAMVDHAQVSPGQRFSYLLKTKSVDELQKMKRSQFWIRYESRERPESITGYALLKYVSNCKDEKPHKSVETLPEVPPVKLPETTNDYLEYTLQSKSEEDRANFPRLDQVTRTVTIQINQMLTSGEYKDGYLNGSLVWVQNGFAWKEDVQAAANQVPYLISAYQSGQMPNYSLALEHGGFDPESKTFPARVGEVIDIVWQNNGGVTGNFDIHPMHIHGEHAYDLGSGNGTYNAAENDARFGDFIPARRDTTILYRYTKRGVPETTAGWRAWRIRITEDNIGAWMMHCHIAQHSAMGMNTVWVFGERDDIVNKFPELPYTQGYTEFGGSAYGNRNRDPVVNRYFRS